MIMYQNGNEEAFNELFTRYNHRVYSYVSKKISTVMLRNELTQEIFLKLHRSKSNYSSNYPFEAWLFVIARSVVFDHFRKIKSETKLKQEDLLTDKGENLIIDTDSLLSNLKPEAQNIIKLKFLDELSYEEISKLVNKKELTIRQIVSRGIKHLKRSGEKYGRS